MTPEYRPPGAVPVTEVVIFEATDAPTAGPPGVSAGPGSHWKLNCFATVPALAATYCDTLNEAPPTGPVPLRACRN